MAEETTEETTEFEIGQIVEKYTGEARWFGTIVAKYRTLKGSTRYVVEVSPQGFQMIAVGSQLRKTDSLLEGVMIAMIRETGPDLLADEIARL